MVVVTRLTPQPAIGEDGTSPVKRQLFVWQIYSNLYSVSDQSLVRGVNSYGHLAAALNYKLMTPRGCSPLGPAIGVARSHP
jgi:hypothetical protein